VDVEQRRLIARLAALAGRCVAPVALSGESDRDAQALRAAAEGGADMAFDMVGGARDPSSTLAAEAASVARSLEAVVIRP